MSKKRAKNSNSQPKKEMYLFEVTCYAVLLGSDSGSYFRFPFLGVVRRFVECKLQLKILQRGGEKKRRKRGGGRRGEGRETRRRGREILILLPLYFSKNVNERKLFLSVFPYFFLPPLLLLSLRLPLSPPSSLLSFLYLYFCSHQFCQSV